MINDGLKSIFKLIGRLILLGLYAFFHLVSVIAHEIAEIIKKSL